MFSFFSTILLGLIAAVIGSYLQFRSWRHRQQEEIRYREFTDCSEIIEKIGRAIDVRLVSHRDFLAKLDTGAAKEQDYLEFQASRFRWMEDFSSFKSKLFLYFGKSVMLEFENNIHRLLFETAAVIGRTYNLGFENLSIKHREEHRSVGGRMSFTQRECVMFLNRLNERISNDEFGRTQLINNIDFGKLDSISTLYLVQRLFGIKS